MSDVAVTNPLVDFRVPEALQSRHGKHFQTTRDEVYNAEGTMLNIFMKEFRYKLDPTLEIEIKMWEDRQDLNSRRTFLTMTGPNEGFQPMMAAEWEIEERLKHVWKADVSGRVTFNGDATNTFVLMWRTGTKSDESAKRKLRWSDDVQRSAEEKQAMMQDKLAPLGAHVEMSVEDDDGTDDVQVKRGLGRPRRK